MLSAVDAVLQRRSVRGFLPQPLDDGLVQRIFTLAQQAPSNCNTQPWVVHVASGDAAATLRRRLTEAGRDPAQHRPDFPFDGRYPGVYRERQFDAAQQLYGAMGIAP